MKRSGKYLNLRALPSGNVGSARNKKFEYMDNIEDLGDVIEACFFAFVIGFP